MIQKPAKNSFLSSKALQELLSFFYVRMMTPRFTSRRVQSKHWHNSEPRVQSVSDTALVLLLRKIRWSRHGSGKDSLLLEGAHWALLRRLNCKRTKKTILWREAWMWTEFYKVKGNEGFRENKPWTCPDLISLEWNKQTNKQTKNSYN